MENERQEDAAESPWLSSLSMSDGEVVFYSATEPYRKFCDHYPTLLNKMILNYNYGWMLCYDYMDQSSFMLFNLKTGDVIPLPVPPVLQSQSNRNYINTGIIWLPPENPMSKVLLFDMKRLTILCYHISGERWTELNYKNDAKKIIFGNGYNFDYLVKPVNCNNRLYAMLCFCEKIVEIDIIEGSGTHPHRHLQVIKPLKSEFPVDILIKQQGPSDFYCHERWLVESQGELFAINIVRKRHDAKVVDVRVFRWDFSSVEQRWRYMKGSEIKDRAFFISYGHQPLLSCTTVGQQFDDGGGRVYFINATSKPQYSYKHHIYSYDVEEGSMTLHMSLPSIDWDDQPTWVMLPNPIRKDDGEEMEKTKKKTNTKSNSECKRVMYFHDLPYDIMETVAKKIRPVDCMNLRATCKACCQLTPTVRWGRSSLALQIQPQCSLLPWLMFSSGDRTTHHFIDMKFGGTFTIEADKLVHDATIHYSKNGWVLMTNMHNLFFYNPFSKEVIKFSKALKHAAEYDRLCFTDIPTSPDCIVMGVKCNLVCYFDMRQQCWSFNLRYDRDFSSIGNAPVFFRGFFYILSGTGVLHKLVFENGRLTEMVRSLECPSAYIKQKFLLEWDERLAAVFIDEEIRRLEVFVTVDETMRAWEEVSNLGGSSFFLSSSSAFSVTTNIPELENKIYLSKIHEKDKIIFYCFKTGIFGYTRSEEEIDSFFGTKEYLSSCWIQPNCSTSSV